MHCCSEAEADNMGIFFSELFELLNHWSKRVNWNRECQGYTGFAKSVGSDTISFEEFVNGIAEPINKRFAKTLMDCFQTDPKMYMKTRCSLLILNRASQVFPNSYRIAQAI